MTEHLKARGGKDGSLRLLLIAYAFPPFQDAQSLRWYYIANALGALGDRVDVVTIDHPAPSDRAWEFHPNVSVERVFPGPFERVALGAKKSLGVDAPGNEELRSTPGFRLMKALYKKARDTAGDVLPGDIRTEWLPFVLARLAAGRRTADYDAVITSHEPGVDSHAGLIMRRLHSFKWVADFGDPYVAPYTPSHKLWIENRIEKSVYARADLLLFTTGRVVDELVKKYPFMKGKKTLVLEQGFSLSAAEEGRKAGPNAVFTMTYCGTFYKEMRNPRNIIGALGALDGDYRFIMAGRNESFLEDFASLGPRLEFLGFVDHRRALDLERASDILVHLSNSRPIQVPGKIYEYLCARKPILCISDHPEDEAARLVDKLKCGVVCKNEPGRILDALKALRRAFSAGTWRSMVPSENDIRPYSWEQKAATLHEALLDV